MERRSSELACTTTLPSLLRVIFAWQVGVGEDLVVNGATLVPARGRGATSPGDRAGEAEKSGAGELAEDGRCIHDGLAEGCEEPRGRQVDDSWSKSRFRVAVGDNGGFSVGRRRI